MLITLQRFCLYQNLNSYLILITSYSLYISSVVQLENTNSITSFLLRDATVNVNDAPPTDPILNVIIDELMYICKLACVFDALEFDLAIIRYTPLFSTATL